MKYKPLDALLRESEVVFTCLNKNVLLLGEPEFEALGEGKVLFNTSIGPGFDSAALEKWWISPAPTSSAIPTPPQAPSARASSGGPMSTARESRQAAPGRLSFC